AEQLERSLCRNPQYAYARRLGQLRAVQLVQVDGLYERYVTAQLEAGARLGDVKPVVLGSKPGWLSRLGVRL
ncbi:MAG TPA: Auxin-responsive GH3-related protein, partial [Gammaproteobacteria bacterium]|nr:Auxin-responsive GH3-related protein [Gammaproteobacteria bacterium]